MSQKRLPSNSSADCIIEPLEQRRMCNAPQIYYGTNDVLVVECDVFMHQVVVKYGDNGVDVWTSEDGGNNWSNSANWAPTGLEIYGNLSDDFLANETDIPSLMYGGGGNDILSGGTGSDTLYGEGDQDELYGSGWDQNGPVGDGQIDYLYGGAGNDDIKIENTLGPNVTRIDEYDINEFPETDYYSW